MLGGLSVMVIRIEECRSKWGLTVREKETPKKTGPSAGLCC
jgi:hypothetical protein